MDYMTLKEAAEKWGVTPRRVNYYCAAGRIPGAVKMAGVWLIPKNAEKPIDGRTKQGKELRHTLHAALPFFSSLALFLGLPLALADTAGHEVAWFSKAWHNGLPLSAAFLTVDETV